MSENRVFSSREARQGTIVMKTPLRRFIFIGGLLLVVILGIILACTA